VFAASFPISSAKLSRPVLIKFPHFGCFPPAYLKLVRRTSASFFPLSLISATPAPVVVVSAVPLSFFEQYLFHFEPGRGIVSPPIAFIRPDALTPFPPKQSPPQPFRPPVQILLKEAFSSSFPNSHPKVGDADSRLNPESYSSIFRAPTHEISCSTPSLLSLVRAFTVNQLAIEVFRWILLLCRPVQRPPASSSPQIFFSRMIPSALPFSHFRHRNSRILIDW